MHRTASPLAQPRRQPKLFAPAPSGLKMPGIARSGLRHVPFRPTLLNWPQRWRTLAVLLVAAMVLAAGLRPACLDRLSASGTQFQASDGIDPAILKPRQTLAATLLPKTPAERLHRLVTGDNDGKESLSAVWSESPVPPLAVRLADSVRPAVLTLRLTHSRPDPTGPPTELT